MLPHFFDIRPVHVFEVCHALQKNVYVQDVIEIRTDRFKHDLERIENLFGLVISIRPGKLACCWIYARRSADGNEFTYLGNMAIRADRDRCAEGLKS